MVEAALRGVGIAFVPQLLAEPYLRTGKLRTVLEDWCPDYPGQFLYYPGHRLVPSHLRAFIDVLKTTPSTAFQPVY
jgi:DNA-binding transcriptional LysR family regulator